MLTYIFDGFKRIPFEVNSRILSDYVRNMMLSLLKVRTANRKQIAA